MILADTSIWVDHLRRDDGALRDFLEAGAVLMHPFVIGEIALGSLRDRHAVLAPFHRLPRSAVATDAEVSLLIETGRLHGRGIGYVDAHLLAAARLTADAALWTRDRRLSAIAAELGLAFPEPGGGR